DQLLAVGVDPREVLYSNPVKPADHVERAHRAGVWRFAFDSHHELRKLARHAPGAAAYVRIAAPKHDSAVPSEGKFGVDSTHALDLMRLARSLGLRPYGIVFHVGSQMGHPGPWDLAIRECGLLMQRLLHHDIEIEMLDIGGGFPAYYSEDTPTIEEYGGCIAQAIERHLPYGVEVAAEPGRYLVAEA